MAVSVLAVVIGCRSAGTVDRPTPVSSEAARETDERTQAEVRQRLAQGDFAGAVAPLRELAKRNPNDTETLTMLGTCVLRSPDPRRFADQARKELTADPNDVVALTVAAAAFTGPELQKERLDVMKRLAERRPDDPLVRLDLAVEYVAAHQYDLARPLLDRMIEQKPDEPMGYLLRGRITLEEASTDEALRRAETDLKTAIRLRPTMATAHLSLGRIALRRNRPEAAIKAFETAYRHQPNSGEILYERARTYRLLGNAEKANSAEKALRRYRELEMRSATLVTRCGAFPDDFELHLETVRALAEKGDYQRAAPFLRRAMQLRPDDDRTRRLMEDLRRRAAQGAGS
ncbi:MAG: tetratricopeptide repeat protein [Capsulimonadales bacterium]|nr:tetratricopeptide repeat protein [Capsulimonadales bacterium]